MVYSKYLSEGAIDVTLVYVATDSYPSIPVGYARLWVTLLRSHLSVDSVCFARINGTGYVSSSLSFQKAIKADILDTANRLVFSDWLEERCFHEEAQWQRDAAECIDRLKKELVHPSVHFGKFRWQGGRWIAKVQIASNRHT
jgi:uncharacterized protein (TIGR02996 family)